MSGPATQEELQLMACIYDDMEHGRLDAAAVRVREYLAAELKTQDDANEILTRDLAAMRVQLSGNIKLRTEVEEQRDRLISDLEKLARRCEETHAQHKEAFRLTQKFESQRDALVMAMNNILISSKWSHTPPMAYATIAREVLASVEFPEGCTTDVSVRIEEEQRQIIVLALAKLTFSRPGWSHALLDTAKKLQGEAMFQEFIKHGPDPEK